VKWTRHISMNKKIQNKMIKSRNTVVPWFKAISWHYMQEAPKAPTLLSSVQRSVFCATTILRPSL